MSHKVLFLVAILALSMSSCNREKGCMDIYACNFSITAEKDDGSCIFVGDECNDADPTTVNDVMQSNCNCAGVSDSSSTVGCTDDAACNYNPNAIEDNGSCFYIGDSCNDNNPDTTNDTINGNCDCVGSAEGEVQGCTDSSACNYNPAATTNNGSCVFIGDPCNDNNGNTTNDTYNSNCDCVGETTVYGCMDTNACNYDTNANMNLSSSCDYPGDPCNDGDPQTEDDQLNNNCDCEGTPISTAGCEFDIDGYATVTIGVYADQYVNECTYELFVTADPSITTGDLSTTIANGMNESIYNITAGNWTMMVSDSYGDGKGSGGYYYAKCAAIGGGDIIFFETPFEDGYESSTDFTVY